ncbi:MAG: hypothetical protein QOA70_06895 [Nitrososphaeraceae archaeon]|nr:hypothetical protein [Nitrososphaeraceae archaeon]
MKHKSNIALVAFGKTPKRIRREKIEKALQELNHTQVIEKSVAIVQDIRTTKKERDRLMSERNEAIERAKALVKKINDNYGIR